MQSDRSKPAQSTDGGDARLPYLPGLDGLRALAVIAVLLYHAGVNVRGGFLGVESFFVLSGFLITALLAAEWRQHGRINLVAFWQRRFRRLLPALLVVLLGTLALAFAFAREEASGLGAQIAAALSYTMNWYLALSDHSYFDPTARPPLLQHLWSLAIEEQFYLIWPLLFAIGMRYLRSFGVLLAVLGAALASALLMAGLYEPGVDPSRIYYGTDTRAAGLLIGVALALLWVPGRLPGSANRRVGVALDVFGVLALFGLLASYLWVYEAHPLLYRGGFALIALVTAAVIAAVVHPRARVLPRILSWQPLRWVGLRSYGIYLWHWPIFVVTQPYEQGPLNLWLLLAARAVVVLALAECSYRLVELPIRHGALTRWRKQLAAPAALPVRRANVRSVAMPKRWVNLVTANMLLMSSVACAAPNDISANAVNATSIVPLPSAQVAAAPALATAPATIVASAPTVVPATVVPPTVPATELPAATAPAAATEAPTAPPAPTAVALQAFDAELAAELQRILDTIVADGFIPGAVLAVTIPGQEPWIGASGIADRASQQPMQTDTHLRIASISKIFTSVVILQLMEEGQIELDAPISTWLPDLVPNGEKITVRNLLNHTSGLYDYLEDKNYVTQAYRDPGRIWQPRELVEYAVKFAPSFQPGAAGRWDYSSTNYVLLGMIAEQVTGNTLAERDARGVSLSRWT